MVRTEPRTRPPAGAMSSDSDSRTVQDLMRRDRRGGPIDAARVFGTRSVIGQYNSAET